MLDFADRTLSPAEIDAILNETNLLTAKQRKRLTRMKKRSDGNTRQQHPKDISLKTDLKAKNKKQQLLINTITSKDQTIVVGSAGTGKTYVTASLAIIALKEKKIDRIVLTRPNVPTGRSIGFFPGTLEEKMAPWVGPVMQVFREYVGQTSLDYYIKHGKIEILPFEVIRGHSLNNAFIILDEAQNTTKEEIQAFLTRVGESSKAVIDGDIIQSDLGENNGLAWALHESRHNKYLDGMVGVVEFNADDVVRSGICQAWVRVIESQHKGNKY